VLVRASHGGIDADIPSDQPVRVSLGLRQITTTHPKIISNRDQLPKQALEAIVADRWAWRAGVESLPYSGRTFTSESHALISQLDCASTSAAVTGRPFHDVSIALLMVL
jgi:hypothetical protein